MSEQRSPKRAITYDDSNDYEPTRSESQPDLRRSELSKIDNQPITMRKRKQPDDDLCAKFDAFEKKIMSVLTGMALNQTEKLDKISQEVSLITIQIAQIKTTTDQLVTEQVKMKQELENITICKADLEQKVEHLKKDVGILQNASQSQAQTLTSATHDNILSEIYDRSQREKNIIVCGVAEKASNNLAERFNHDKEEVMKIINPSVPSCSDPTKVMRLGKYSSDKCRPIKACFAAADTAQSILRRKSTIDSEEKGIKIFYDLTPCQKNQIDNVRKELQSRIDKGEKDLTIKYIKGTPKIIQNK